MTEQTTSLRERKKARTQAAISSAAIALFQERGFDQVTVADVAAAAEVSKPTLFSYFPSKEDLVLHRISDHQGEYAALIRARPEGVGPIEALLRHHLDGLAVHDPLTGLNDTEPVLRYLRLVFETPSLENALHKHVVRDEVQLAAALLETTGATPFVARLAAAQVIAVLEVLSGESWRAILAGKSAADRYPEAVAAAELAFGSLRAGLPEALR